MGPLQRHSAYRGLDWVPQTDKYRRVVKAEPVIHERAGYWKEINGTLIHCFNAEGLQRASSGFGKRKVVEVLDAAGALVDRDSGKHTKAIWIPELKRSVRCYMVNPERLELSL